MKIENGVVTLDSEAIEPRREWQGEDLDHIKDAILELQELTGAIALPGLESVYHQISLRLGFAPSRKQT